MSGPLAMPSVPAPVLPSAAAAAAATAASPTDPKLAKVARQFEALFVRQMLAAAHKANFGDSMFASQAADTFRDMQDQKYADIASQKGSFGMARMIEKQLSHQAQRTIGATAGTTAANPAATAKTGG